MKIYTVVSSCFGNGASFENINEAIESLNSDFVDDSDWDIGDAISIVCKEVSEEKWKKVLGGPEWAGW